jgi:rhamnulokinase
MKKEMKFVGFDLGAESGRCVVAVLNEEKVILNEVHRFTTHNIKYQNGFHWDVLAIYQELIEGLRKAKKEFGSHYDGIGIDTWGVDYALIDSDERILGYPYHYRDDRTDAMMEEAFKIVPQEELYRQAGIQFAQFNTLFQLLAEKNTKLNLLRHADKMLMMPDFLNFLLTGKKKAEFTIASTTSLIDPRTRNWHWGLIDSFDIPQYIFPEVIEPGTFLGPLLESISTKVGLDPNIPVYASAGHDTASAVVSVPAKEKGWAFLSSGTWSLMGVETNEPILTHEAMRYNFTNEGGVEKTTRFLKNIIGLWPVQECRRYWSEHGKEFSYQQLADLAQKEKNVNAWVDLNDPRFLKAGEMPNKVLAFLKETNQTGIDDVGFIMRVILESLAYCYRSTIKQIEEVTGNKIEVLHAVGGGIQNEFLTHLTADVIGRPVIAGPIEGTIIGNIGVVAIASGAVKNLSDWRAIVSRSFDVKKYHPVDANYFQQNEKTYLSILKNKE